MTADPSGTMPSGADPTPRSTRHWIHRWFVFLIVGFAGFCSLVYQVVWERTLKYNFGGDSVSAAIVTATFLLGLGIGAVAFGRWRRQPFAAFALVGLGLGTFAIASYHGSYSTEAFAAPVHGPDFKSCRSNRGSWSLPGPRRAAIGRKRARRR